MRPWVAANADEGIAFPNPGFVVTRRTKPATVQETVASAMQARHAGCPLPLVCEATTRTYANGCDALKGRCWPSFGLTTQSFKPIVATSRIRSAAESLLAYELPDGRLKLIDGHLRRDLEPDMEMDVEVLDGTDEEARALLLSIDPLAALAETQEQIQRRLLEITPTDDEELAAA
jgi:hypothetical protein